MSAASTYMSTAGESFLRVVSPSVHGGVDPVALRAEGVAPVGFVDFSSNQSPLGAAPEVAAAVAGAVVDAYPDPRATELCAALATCHGVAPAQIVAGHGSTELIRLLAQLTLGADDVALALTPAFGEYEVGTLLAGARFAELPLEQTTDGGGFFCDEASLRASLTSTRPRLCWLCSPNNPTGAALPAALIAALVNDYENTLFVLDEAYCDLLAEPQWTPALLAAGNLVVLRSLSKTWGLAGLRLGYAIAAETLASPLRAAAPPWNVNACAQAAGLAAIAAADHHDQAVALLHAGRDYLVAQLRARGWAVEPTAAGFFLVRVGDASAARRALLTRGCLVRDCTSFGLPRHIRVSPRFGDHNELLLAAFAELDPPPADAPATDARSLAGRPFFCSWSGGKDSYLALQRAVQQGGRCAALLCMLEEGGARSRGHGLPAAVLAAQAAALGVPLVTRATTWDGYEQAFVSALHELRDLGIEDGVFGDIDLLPHREWVQRVCHGAGFYGHLPLWLEPRPVLIDELLASDVCATIVAVDATRLDASFLGRVISLDLVADLETAGIDACGEDGEYHTFVSHAPLFSSPIPFVRGSEVERDGHWILTIVPFAPES